MCGCNGGDQSNALGLNFLSKSNRPKNQVLLPRIVNNNALAIAIIRARNSAPSRKRPQMGMVIR